MPSQPITAEDLGAALSAFALSFTAVIMSPRHETPNEVLEALANELHDMAASMTTPEGEPTPAREAVTLAAQLLMASEVQPRPPRKRSAK